TAGNQFKKTKKSYITLVSCCSNVGNVAQVII
ncbi:MAG: hypothetical protein ACJA0Q_002120, partial [Saprospiraceae bacterium]